MELLTVGELARTVKVGVQPGDQMTVQVLATKVLGDNSCKQRLKLWDGESEVSQAVLDLSSTPEVGPPPQYSVVRLQGARLRMAGQKWAVIVTGYSLLRPGDQIGKKLEASNNSTTNNGNSSTTSTNGGFVGTPPATAQPQRSVQPTPAKAPAPAPLPPSQRINQVKRNLNESFASPPGKRPGGPGAGDLVAPTHQVKDISPYTNKFILKVRVEQKGNPRNLNTRNFSGSVLDCVLTDPSGQIKLTAWGRDGQRDVADMMEQLEEGGTYLVTGPQVKPVQNTMYNHTGHHYELTWTQLTRVKGPLTTDTVQLNYNFVTLSEVVEMDVGSMVDVLAWVKEAGPCNTFTSKNGRELTKREVLLSDPGAQVSLTLWAEKAQNFSAEGKVIAVKGAKVQEFQGKKSLGFAFTGSSYEVEPEVEGVADLMAWAEGQQVGGMTQGPSQLGMEARLQEGIVTIQHIKQQVEHSRGEAKYTVAALPTRINMDNMFYRAHNPGEGGSRCRKKVQEEAGPGATGLYSCRCGAKALTPEQTSLRYMVRLCLADCTDYEWASMFDAESLFGMTAQELNDLKESSHDDFLMLVNGLQFRERLWTVIAKVEDYQGDSKLKLTLQDTMAMDWEGGHLNSLSKEVESLQQQLGVNSSEIERWGVDLAAVLSRIDQD